MKFSIITINYNNQEGLRQTIESVAKQTIHDYEYIIIDGGSNDGGVDVIRENENDVDFWVSEKDNGIYNAMNKGLQHTHGDYVIFMNSGDCFHNNHVLKEIAEQLDDTDILFGNVIDAATKKIYGGIKAGSEVTFLTLKKEILCHQGTFYKREIFDRHPYDESLKLIADWKVNVQAIVFDNCKVKVVDTIIADYNLTGISSVNSQLHGEERLRVMAELFPRRILKDYEHLYTDEEMPIISLLPQLKQTRRIQKYGYWFIKFMLQFCRARRQLLNN